MDTGEPFGLPRGTVRGIIALAMTATLIAHTFLTGTLDGALVALTSPYIGFYFGSRNQEALATPPEAPLAKPYVDGADSD
jgi:hypothetical protein